jgi:pilus assembly protein Flp/PilA
MKKFLQKILGDKSGASAAEYALILAVFGGAVVTGVGFLSTGFQTSMTTSAAELTSN